VDEMCEKLEEAGGASAAQVEVSRRKEAEATRLRKELEEAGAGYEAAIGQLRRRQQEVVADVGEQLEAEKRWRMKAEKDRERLRDEVAEVRTDFLYWTEHDKKYYYKLLRFEKKAKT